MWKQILGTKCCTQLACCHLTEVHRISAVKLGLETGSQCKSCACLYSHWTCLGSKTGAVPLLMGRAGFWESHPENCTPIAQPEAQLDRCSLCSCTQGAECEQVNGEAKPCPGTPSLHRPFHLTPSSTQQRVSYSSLFSNPGKDDSVRTDQRLLSLSTSFSGFWIMPKGSQWWMQCKT